MKIKCQVCGVSSYLQHIGRNYFRVRHYLGYKNSKPKFQYHRQEPSYIHKLLGENMGQTGQCDRTTILDQNKLISSLKQLEEFDADIHFFWHTNSHNSSHNSFFCVDINESFMDSHLPSIPCWSAFS